MQAIITKFIPYTNCRGSRIKAKCSRGEITINLGGRNNSQIAHVEAAQLLRTKFVNQDFLNGQPKDTNPWSKPLLTGEMPDGNYCHVFFN